jgi:hypothetical protein
MIDALGFGVATATGRQVHDRPPPPGGGELTTTDLSDDEVRACAAALLATPTMSQR